MEKALYPEKPILCVDDHEFWLVNLKALLSKYCNIDNIVTCSDGNEVLPLLAENTFSLVLLDYEMPEISGEELLPLIVNLYPHLPVIVLTGHDDVDKVVRCMEMGATNYFIKSNDQEQLANCIQDSLLSLEINKTRESLETEGVPRELIDEVNVISPVMRKVFSSIGMTAGNCEPLTLVGERGVGKRMMAETLLKLRRGGVFVEVDAAGEAGLDCIEEKVGASLKNSSHGGVVYVKNLDSSSLEFQRDFLFCLQSQKKIDGKIVVALRERPEESCHQGKMRSDLANLLRLNLVEIPPLRERKEDIPFLTHHFLNMAAEQAGKKPPATPSELELLLKSYHFPGNVRELRDMICDAIRLHGSRKLSMNSFKEAIERGTDKIEPSLAFSEILPTIEQAIDLLIQEAEKRAQGNQTIMANMLGISRPALNKRLQKLRNKR